VLHRSSCQPVRGTGVKKYRPASNFRTQVVEFRRISEVGRSQGNSAGRSASVLGPRHGVAICCARAGQALPGSKEENAICKNLTRIRDQLPMSSSAANVILCRCYTRYSLARPLEALCSRVPGSAETCRTAEATVEIPDLWRNLRRVKEI
jgi:hypothetical protein